MVFSAARATMVGMIKILTFCAAAALALTGAACAQSQGGPSSGMRAQMQQARDNAKTASFKALSADHQAKVQAIVDDFNSGKVNMPTAASQIEALLTPDEASAILAQEQTMRDARRQAFSAAGSGRMSGAHGNRTGQERKPDAGQFLLSVAGDPQKVRDAMRAMRGGQGGPP